MKRYGYGNLSINLSIIYSPYNTEMVTKINAFSQFLITLKNELPVK